jgi:succinoglycan biosynthesis transport protein ExoP
MHLRSPISKSALHLKVAPAQKASGYFNEQIKLLREKFEDAQNRMSAYQKEQQYLQQ